MEEIRTQNKRGWPERAMIWTVGGFGLGIAFGLLCNIIGWGGDSLAVSGILEPAAAIYLNALKLIAVPVAFCSILACVSGMADLKSLGRVGGRILLLFSVTSLLAIGVSMGLFALLQPARGFTMAAAEAYGGAGIVAPSLKDTLVGIVPDNIFTPFAEANMLQLIFLAVLLGLAMNLQGERCARLTALVAEANALFIRVAGLLIMLAPAAAFCAMARLIAISGVQSLLPLLKLLGAIGAGMLAMLLCYALMLGLARLDPRVFYRKWASNLLIAFSLNCASATVPITLDTCNNRLGTAPSISALTIPLGATINMDGTCVYLCLSALFLAQVYGVELTLANQLAVVISIFALSVGAPGIPGSGLVCLSLLATQIGIPMEGVGLLMGMDKLFGMMRSGVNVTSDAVNTLLVSAWEKQLDKQIFLSR